MQSNDTPPAASIPSIDRARLPMRMAATATRTQATALPADPPVPSGSHRLPITLSVAVPRSLLQPPARAAAPTPAAAAAPAPEPDSRATRRGQPLGRAALDSLGIGRTLTDRTP